MPQLGSAQNLHSSGSLEPEKSSSNSSLAIAHPAYDEKFESGLQLFFFPFFSEYKAVSEVLDRIKGVASEAIVKQVGAIYLFDVKGMYYNFFQ